MSWMALGIPSWIQSPPGHGSPWIEVVDSAMTWALVHRGQVPWWRTCAASVHTQLISTLKNCRYWTYFDILWTSVAFQCWQSWLYTFGCVVFIHDIHSTLWLQILICAGFNAPGLGSSPTETWCSKEGYGSLPSSKFFLHCEHWSCCWDLLWT